MSFKAILFCAQAFLIQAISSQCIGAYNGLADGYGWGVGPYAMDALSPWGTDWASPCNGDWAGAWNAADWAGPWGAADRVGAWGAGDWAGPWGAADWAGPWGAGEWAGPWNSAGRMRAAEYDAGFGYGINSGLMAATVAASNGGGLAVTSSSPISPNGVSLLSENAIEGPLLVSGEIPFLGAVALEGALPTAGTGGVAYGCGNGNVAILNEDLSAYGAYEYGSAIAPALGPMGAAAGLMGPGLAGPYAPGLAGPAAYGYRSGCGCGRI